MRCTNPLAITIVVTLGCGESDAGPPPAGATNDSSAGPTSSDDAPTSVGDVTSDGGDGCTPSEPIADGVVSTTNGPVEGASIDGVAVFRGIPYAAPPIDGLRWQPPVDPQCWSEVRAATTPGSRCAQLESDTGPVVGDEDCLYLDVWSPTNADAASPVMVFLHGGGHAVGTGSDPLYDGANLARAHGVVVVTINYRLGALGYLAHASLDADDPRGVSGNYGLLDQIHALRWVADNAAAFGGDPARVTLFGESAGAVGTCAVIGSPDAAGLLHGAIVQSGTCSQRSADTYRADVGDPWIAASPCAGDADIAACLRALPVETIVTNAPTGFPSVSALGQVWSAYVDGVTLPASTIDQMATGDDLDVPLIIGANAEETARDIPELSEAEYEALVTSTFGPIAAMVLAQYPVADYPSPTAAFVAITSDVKFVCGARRAAAAARQGGDAPVYRYHFSYDGYDVATGDPSAFHGLELVFLFGNFASLLPAPLRYTPNADDVAIADLLAVSWTSFARTGDPSSMALSWPSYSSGDDPYAGLDVPATTGDGVRTETCDFWDGLAGLLPD